MIMAFKNWLELFKLLSYLISQVLSEALAAILLVDMFEPILPNSPIDCDVYCVICGGYCVLIPLSEFNDRFHFVKFYHDYVDYAKHASAQAHVEAFALLVFDLVLKVANVL